MGMKIVREPPVKKGRTFGSLQPGEVYAFGASPIVYIKGARGEYTDLDGGDQMQNSTIRESEPVTVFRATLHLEEA